MTLALDRVAALARLAGLLHDWGKIAVPFQKRLRAAASAPAAAPADPVRHELVSAILARRLFDALDIRAGAPVEPPADSPDAPDASALAPLLRAAAARPATLPAADAPLGIFYPTPATAPGAAARNIVLWLILSHHRLPADTGAPRELSGDPDAPFGARAMADWYAGLAALTAGRHADEAPARVDLTPGLETDTDWLAALGPALAAAGTLSEAASPPEAGGPPRAPAALADPAALRAASLLGRMALIVADRQGSAAAPDRHPGRGGLAANTRPGAGHGALNQPLGWHLRAVADRAGEWAGRLLELDTGLAHLAAGENEAAAPPRPATEAPRVSPGGGRSGNDAGNAWDGVAAGGAEIAGDAGAARPAEGAAPGRFAWQDAACAAVATWRRAGGEPARGFFGAFRAGTGSGKTRGAARLMAALSDPVPTQTGTAPRTAKAGHAADAGRAARTTSDAASGAPSDAPSEITPGAAVDSTPGGGRGQRFSVALPMRTLTLQTARAYERELGMQPGDMVRLVGGSVEVTETAGEGDDLRIDPIGEISGGRDDLPAAISDLFARHPKRAALVATPVSVSTVDFLMPAVAQARTNFVLSVFRVATADLIIDEIDAFEAEDLIALGRLIHLAGFFRRRVAVASASATPEILGRLEEAYRSGCELRDAVTPGDGPHGVGYFDAATARVGTAGPDTLRAWAASARCPPPRASRRIAWRNETAAELKALGAEGVRAALRTSIREVHANRCAAAPAAGATAILVRLSRIESVIEIARYLDVHGLGDDVNLGILCWHARLPLAQRGRVEAGLNRLLDRHRDPDLAQDPLIAEIPERIAGAPKCLAVIATPVAELGQDHDYDGAVLEPASLRSIEQSSGRVNRHRDTPVTAPNVIVLPAPLRGDPAGRRAAAPLYTRPGPETRGSIFGSSYRLRARDRTMGRITTEAERAHPLASLWHGDTRSAPGTGCAISGDARSAGAEERGGEAGALAALEARRTGEHLARPHTHSLRGYAESPAAWLSDAHFRAATFRASEPRRTVSWDPERRRFLEPTTRGLWQPTAATTPPAEQDTPALERGVLNAPLSTALAPAIDASADEGHGDLRRRLWATALPAHADTTKLRLYPDLGVVAAPSDAAR